MHTPQFPGETPVSNVREVLNTLDALEAILFEDCNERRSRAGLRQTVIEAMHTVRRRLLDVVGALQGDTEPCDFDRVMTDYPLCPVKVVEGPPGAQCPLFASYTNGEHYRCGEHAPRDGEGELEAGWRHLYAEA